MLSETRKMRWARERLSRVFRWSNYTDLYDLQPQSVAEHVGQLLIMAVPILERVNRTNIVSGDIVLKSLAMHYLGQHIYAKDVGEGRDIPHRDRTPEHDLNEYNAFLELTEGLPKDDRARLESYYLLPLSVNMPQNFPDSAKEIMQGHMQQHAHYRTAALVFKTIEAYQAVCYAADMDTLYEARTMHVHVLRNLLPELDKLAKSCDQSATIWTHDERIRSLKFLDEHKDIPPEKLEIVAA